MLVGVATTYCTTHGHYHLCTLRITQEGIPAHSDIITEYWHYFYVYNKCMVIIIQNIRVENSYLLESFHGSMFVDLYCQSTRLQFMGKDSRLSEKQLKPQKFPPQTLCRKAHMKGLI